MLNKLIKTYNTLIKEQGLLTMNADEFVWEECVNSEQRKWLLAFSAEWKATEELVQ